MFEEMSEITDFSKGRRNPFAERIKREGYTIRTTEYYTPKDVAGGYFDDTKEVLQALIDLMTVPESKQLLTYIRENYDLPCSPHIWKDMATAQ